MASLYFLGVYYSLPVAAQAKIISAVGATAGRNTGTDYEITNSREFDVIRKANLKSVIA
jgi:hypothetical protein